ncbi:MAG: hypothetical protein AB8C02_08990 [Halioglobus sp.]
MEANSKITLRIPPQDVTDFTLFPLNAHAARGWAQALPVTNTEAVVELIDQALHDLSRVKVGPEVRFEVLEALLPSLNVALTNLSKRFLNQPLIMPSGPQKMADIAARLNTRASTAYTVIAVEAIQNRDSVREINPALLTCQALQRALVYSGRNVLQTFQLFRPLEIHGWRSLHQLYALAEAQGLADLPLPEPRTGPKTIRTTYLQALLLGCCKPNRLRQADLTSLFKLLEDWSEQVLLESAESAEGLFLVDMQSDQPPIYRTLYRKEPSQQCRSINTDNLVARLEQLQSDSSDPETIAQATMQIPQGLLDHLLNSLGEMSLRNFKRSPSIGELRVCIGLRNAHYHVGGEIPFEELVHGKGLFVEEKGRTSSNPFMDEASKSDVWQQANPSDYSATEYDEEILSDLELDQGIEISAAARAAVMNNEELHTVTDDDYAVYSVTMADASPGGYCLEWNSNMPTDIRSGDIVGLKEEDNENWVIAVIRWFGRFHEEKTLIGLELLSPRATALGASVQQKTSEPTPPIRVLQLPEIKLVGQPDTLITPRAGFREGQKVNLYAHNQQYSVQLLRVLSATGTFAQFEYKRIKSLEDLLSKDEDVKLGADYDSLWSNI